jgi:hypothetical protein
MKITSCLPMVDGSYPLICYRSLTSWFCQHSVLIISFAVIIDCCEWNNSIQYDVHVTTLPNRMIDQYTNPLKAHHRSLCEGLPRNGLYQWERVSCVTIQVCIVWRITRKRTISVRAGVMCDHSSVPKKLAYFGMITLFSHMFQTSWF